LNISSFFTSRIFPKTFSKKSFKGYGQSTGRPSEKNLYADIAAALKALETKCQIPPERVILYGQSIGTVPSGFFFNFFLNFFSIPKFFSSKQLT